ncbi:hypothetical protein CONCODRAFT_70303 [Conidiobolus coronatus NRRL 28638]|uniref:Cation/H+ exchanger transmembrane domain-containing protein n=1 Tax=Conidiobolus coronatus (strain ATCC 28846 / CBS 209.66 / NRRL 28638) TaxID=796925 RepID=A0A137P7F3_CONC2|nr:hypothetical protein CONCODRAFT_70303 [Conidiobolus coronatus NRRL 28638]|eukprot:KXN70899.1 hypothetical protein CONCODRAFT_70303 [Conidiobolus coronatus NRRL 28638]
MTNTVEGGFLNGRNPFVFTTDAPITTFILQLVIIICMCRLIKFILSPLKQPAVIAEIIGGILLGPTALSRVAAFKDNVFPKASLPFLNLISNFGLILFLFVVGLELDPRMMKKNFKRCFAISVSGMILPFGLGAAVSYGLYQLVEDPKNHATSFGVYLLFLGVALAITAFPVLARILTELNLLHTEVGSITISAAAVDDATSWCFLALVISLINAGSGLTALYVFLMGCALALVLFIAVRPVLITVLRRMGAFDGNPSQGAIFIAFMICFISAWITDVIGIHAIFGAFLAGVIMPHEGGFAVHIIEKIEDLITILLLPIYFTLSGLKTEIGSLSDGTSWGMVFLVIFAACAVELIVLNLGLDAGVISKKTFAIMVIMALVTTFITTPLINVIYPPSYYNHVEHSEDSEVLVGSKEPKSTDGFFKVMVALNRMEHVPALMTLVQLLQGASTQTPTDQPPPSGSIHPFRKLYVYALRLIEYTGRDSNILQLSEATETITLDPVMNVFRTFVQLTSIGVKTIMKICKQTEFAQTITTTSSDLNADFLLVAWNGSGALIDNLSSPLEQVFGAASKPQTSFLHAEFVRDLYRSSPNCVGVLVDRGFGVSNSSSNPGSSTTELAPSGLNQSIVAFFFGGPDDRASLEFVAALANYTGIKIKIIRFKASSTSLLSKPKLELNAAPASSHDSSSTPEVTSAQTTFYPNQSATFQLQSDQQDEALLDYYFGPTRSNSAENGESRLQYVEVDTFYKNTIDLEVKSLNKKDLIVVGRRNNVITPLADIKDQGIDPERRKALGDLAEYILISSSPASVFVVQGNRSVPVQNNSS